MSSSPVDTPAPRYVGFWARVAAALVDSLLMSFVLAPLVYAIYGPRVLDDPAIIGGFSNFLLNLALPAVAIILFWVYRQATPGKMLIGARIVDEATLQAPTTRQLLIRYLGYYVSTIPLLLGLLWVAFDARKQGWHDKLAGTVVVKDLR